MWKAEEEVMSPKRKRPTGSLFSGLESVTQSGRQGLTRCAAECAVPKIFDKEWHKRIRVSSDLEPARFAKILFLHFGGYTGARDLKNMRVSVGFCSEINSFCA